MSPLRRRGRTAAVLAVAAFALTACANQPAGAASVVGSATITDSDLASAVSAVQSQAAAAKGATPVSTSAATAAVLQNMTRHLILDEAAAREGITVTQAQVDTFLDSVVKGQFNGDRAALEQALAAQNNIPADQINDAARDNLVFNALVAKIAPGVTDSAAQEKAFEDYISKLDSDLGVAVSPRFGTWKAFSLGPVPDDISSPAPLLGSTASPAPAPTDVPSGQPAPTPS